MKRIILLLSIIVLCIGLSSCPDFLGNEPAGRWNPEDDNYDAATDPDAVTDPDGTILSVTITRTDGIDSATPAQSVTWTWEANQTGCSFRYTLTTMQLGEGDIFESDWSDVTTATKDSGDGTWYLYVQARGSDGSTLSEIVTAQALLDNTPPDRVSGFTATAGVESIDLAWGNPAADFAGVMVRYDTDGYPASPTEGTGAYTGTAESVSLSSLTAGQGYSFSAFALDSAGNYDAGRQAVSVPVRRSYALVADYHDGLAIIDITDPGNPGTPVYAAVSGKALCVAVAGNYAYVGDDNGVLSVVDISDPANPGTPAYEDTGEVYVYDVAVAGDYAYLAVEGSGMAIVDISNPANPGTPTFVNTSGVSCGVAVSGEYAYIADSGSGLAVIDISDPASPGAPAYEGVNDYAQGVTAAGYYAYVAAAADGLAVFNVSNPADPGEPVYEATPNAQRVAVKGNYAFVADATNGLAIIDVSNPANPGTPVNKGLNDFARDVAVAGDYAYVADEEDGMVIIDVSDPANPGSTLYVSTSTFAMGVALSMAAQKVAEYTFTSGSLEDTSGYHRDLTAYPSGNGPVLTTDRHATDNAAYKFDGVDDFMMPASDSPLNVSGDFSISLWFNCDNVAVTDRYILSNWSTGAGYEVFINGETLYAAINGNGVLFAHPVTGRSGEWIHFVMVYDSQGYSWYVDGVRVDYGNYAVDPIASTNTLLIGDRPESVVNNKFPGLIDDIRIYEKALQPEKVLELYYE